MELRKLGELFLCFARVGAMTFGGGLAMLPILQRELVERRGWATEEELADYYAVSQCTPGVIAVNTATFVGFKRGGPAGGVAATLGVVSPSLLIITLLAALLRQFAEVPAVQQAFSGIRVCVCVLICNGVVRLWKSAVIDGSTLCIFLGTLALSLFTGLSPVVYVPTAALLGIVVKVLRRDRP